MVAIAVFVIFQLYLSVNSRPDILTNSEPSKNAYASDEGDPGEPLFLTPYIKSGEIEEGKKASRVGRILPDDDFVSYSGFLTVNEEFNSNLFFWFCTSRRDPENAPLLLWLNGGPGYSSLYGLFLINGPYEMKTNGELIRREIAWTDEFNLLYFDQPAGTGFSFTESEAGYATSEEDVARDMYCALFQFFQLFPEYLKNEFYVAGESYAGKYVPSVAYEIHMKNADVTIPVKINLKGCSIGNGYIDSETMNWNADYIYQLGFIDLKTTKAVRNMEDVVKTYVRAGDYEGGLEVPYVDPYSFPFIATYDYTNTEKIDFHSTEKIFENNYIRKCIHVGNLKYLELSDVVSNYMNIDQLQTVLPFFLELLNHYRMLLYTGQLDVRCHYPSVRNFVQNLHFSGAVDYYESDLILWYDEMGVRAGHYKVAANLTDLLFLNVGHAVPKYRPKQALQMIRQFINGEFS